MDLFKSKIFQRQFLSFFLIIFLTFVTISFVLYVVTNISIEKQQLQIAESYRKEVGLSITNWTRDRQSDIHAQALYLTSLGEAKLASPQVTRIIRQQLTPDANYNNLAIIDRHGRVINSKEGKLDNIDLTKRDYFQEAMQGEASVTGFLKSSTTPNPLMVVAEPLFFDGKPKYVLIGAVLLEKYKANIESLKLGELGHIYLVNSEGMFITDSGYIQDFIEKDGIRDKERYRLNTLAVNRVIKKHEGTGTYYDFTGQKVFGSYEWIDPLQVGLVVEFRADKVMNPIQELTGVINVLAVTIILLGLLMAYYLSRRIITPIKMLVNATLNIITNHYQEPIRIKTSSELDILVKQFNNMQAVIRDREKELKRINDELRSQKIAAEERAIRDSLTGLYNHARLIELFGSELKTCQTASKSISFVMVDIDFFKNINDTYGHTAGDVVLRDFAGLLLDKVGEKGCIGRYGGEEFALVLPGLTSEEAHALCENMRNTVAEREFIVDGKIIRLTASFGICFRAANSTLVGLDMVKRADNALYEAKKRGRNMTVTDLTG